MWQHNIIFRRQCPNSYRHNEVGHRPCPGLILAEWRFRRPNINLPSSDGVVLEIMKTEDHKNVFFIWKFKPNQNLYLKLDKVKIRAILTLCAVTYMTISQYRTLALVWTAIYGGFHMCDLWENAKLVHLYTECYIFQYRTKMNTVCIYFKIVNWMRPWYPSPRLVNPVLLAGCVPDTRRLVLLTLYC